MKAKLYNLKEGKTGDITLPEEIFNLDVDSDLIHRVVRTQVACRRQNTAHTKDRSEARGGGRKPWRQKGTGRARHGSRRSPIWIGGGVTFGPRNERNYKKKINKKMKRKALFMVLSAKKKKDLLVFVSDLEIKEPKTKDISDLLNKLPLQGGSVLVILPEMDRNLILSVRNLENVDTMQARDINPLSLLSYKYLIFPKKSVEVIKENFCNTSLKTVKA